MKEKRKVLNHIRTPFILGSDLRPVLESVNGHAGAREGVAYRTGASGYGISIDHVGQSGGEDLS